MYEGDAMDILSQAREARFTRAERVIRDLPECLVVVLDMALAKHPDDRYDACGDMLSDLEDCIYHLNFRPSGQKLSQFMKGLFDDELKTEEASMAWALRKVEPIAPLEDHGQKTDPDYQETRFSHRRSWRPLPAGKKGPGSGWLSYCCFWPWRSVLFWVSQRHVEDKPVVVRVPISSNTTTGDTPEGVSGSAVVKANGASVSASAAAVDPQVAKWLQEAQDNLAAWNLTEPEGRNAYFFYKEVLKRDPDNRGARQGIADIADRYAQLAEREMQRSHNQKALDFIATGLSVDADNRRLWSLKEKINRQAEEQRQRTIQRLLVKANDCLNAYKLTKPTEDNALYFFREVEKLDPRNTEARRGREKIADRYAVLAEKEMNSFDYDNARRYITTGLEVDPDNKHLLELKTEVNKRLDQRVLRSIKNLFN